jgi:hypothetical protein
VHNKSIKKIGQLSAKPNGSGLFARSPNLLIWLLDNNIKQNAKDLAY